MHQKAFLFHNKGYVSTPFKVRNRLANLHRWSNHQKINENQQHQAAGQVQPQLCTSQMMFKLETQGSCRAKPASAPRGTRVRQIQQHFKLVGPVTVSSMEETYLNEDRRERHHNFKATVSNKKPLMFLKPYMRYRNKSVTIEQTKTEVYREIDQSRFQQLASAGVIEYMTEYKEEHQAETETSREGKHNRNRNKSARQHTSINILKEKLKLKSYDEAVTKQGSAMDYRTRIRYLQQAA